MTIITAKQQPEDSRLDFLAVPETGAAGDRTQAREDVTHGISEKEERLALIHRVIIPDKDYPKEYAILVTNSRLIFVRLEKSRRTFVLRYEMKIGTALVTDVVPKTLEDFEGTSL